MRAAPTCVAVKLGRFSRPNDPMTDRRAFVKSVAGVMMLGSPALLARAEIRSGSDRL